MKAEDYGYVVKNNMCLFQKGPFSQWWGGFKGQVGGFSVKSYDISECYAEYNSAMDKWLNTSVQYLEKIKFNCCEQWMMACKAVLFDDVDTFLEVLEEKNPEAQKKLGRKIKNFDAEVWDAHKYHIVVSGNMYKFDQNPELQEFLKSFPVQTIFCEAAPWDKIWGNGLDINDPDSLDLYKWQGENLLGRAISEVRDMY